MGKALLCGCGCEAVGGDAGGAGGGADTFGQPGGPQQGREDSVCGAGRRAGASGFHYPDGKCGGYAEK